MSVILSHCVEQTSKGSCTVVNGGVGDAVGGSVGEVVGGKDGGASKLMYSAGNVSCASARIPSSSNSSETIVRIVNWKRSASDWSLLCGPGLQSAPQASPPAILAWPSAPSWFKKDG